MKKIIFFLVFFFNITIYIGYSQLSTPILIDPQYGWIGIVIDPTYAWYPVEGATNYILHVSLNSNFTNTIVYDNQIEESDYEIIDNMIFFQPYVELNEATWYYWRVKAYNNNGEISPWSETWYFKTALAISGCQPISVIDVTLYMQGLWNSSTQWHQSYPVTIELRYGDSLISSTLTSRKAGMLDSTGTITLDFSDVPDGFYWLVVRSAGYMPLAIPQQITIPACNGVSWDFMTDSSKAVGANNAMIFQNVVWQMRAGDFNSSRSVNTTDLNMMLQSNGKSVSGEVPEP